MSVILGFVLCSINRKLFEKCFSFKLKCLWSSLLKLNPVASEKPFLCFPLETVAENIRISRLAAQSLVSWVSKLFFLLRFFFFLKSGIADAFLNSIIDSRVLSLCYNILTMVTTTLQRNSSLPRSVFIIGLFRSVILQLQPDPSACQCLSIFDLQMLESISVVTRSLALLLYWLLSCSCIFSLFRFRGPPIFP